jgi:phosphoketolase
MASEAIYSGADLPFFRQQRWRDVTPAEEDFSRLDACWRAANYLSVGQLYLLDNPLVREPQVRRALAGSEPR